jgi:hypothetical protein
MCAAGGAKDAKHAAAAAAAASDTVLLLPVLLRLLLQTAGLASLEKHCCSALQYHAELAGSTAGRL